MIIAVSPKANEKHRERIRKRYLLAKDRYLSLLAKNPYEIKYIEYSLDTDLTPPDEYGHRYPVSGGRFAKSHDELPPGAVIARYYDRADFITAFYNGWKRKYGAGSLG